MKDRDMFGLCPESEFFGRLGEIDNISRRAADIDRARPGLLLSGRRWVGKTEVLKRVRKNLFWGQGRVAPVYYQFRPSIPALDFAEDFLRETLRHYIAFRRREPQILGVTLPLERLERLLRDNDMEDAASLVSRHRDAVSSNDLNSAVKNALLAPRSITLASGIPVYLILDDIDLAHGIRPSPGGPPVTTEFPEALSVPEVSFLSSSSWRSFPDEVHLPGYTERVELKGLSEDDSVSMMMELCRLWGVDSDTEALVLLSRKLEGNPMYIKSAVWAARREERPLASLRDIAEIYSGEIISGSISSALRSSIRLKNPDELKILNACSSSAPPLSVDALTERSGRDRAGVEAAVEGVVRTGLVRAELGSIGWNGGRVAADFIRFMSETLLRGRSQEEARTILVREVLKEDFGLKGEKVRTNLKEEVAAALRSFNGQKVPKALLHNRVFSTRFKDGSYTPDASKEEEIALPSVAGCYDSARLEKGETGPPILIAHAFQNARYDTGSEVVWIALVKDSNSPVNAGDIENFMRRSSILKENIRASYAVRWVVGKEGFTEEARSRSDAEGVWTTDCFQLGILRDSLVEKGAPARKGAQARLAPSKEFEVVIPSTSKAELVAAKAVGEIGVEMGFDEDSIGRIKAAVVEACINAFEHGKTRTGRVHLRFIAMADRLAVHVENAGLDFEGQFVKEAPQQGTLPRKRGWGLELMKGLMDEVRFEKIRGGTRIVLVKYLLKKGEAGDDK